MAALIANVNRAKGTKPIEPHDFFGALAPEPVPVQQKVKAIFAGLRRRKRDVIREPR